MKSLTCCWSMVQVILLSASQRKPSHEAGSEILWSISAKHVSRERNQFGFQFPWSFLTRLVAEATNHFSVPRLCFFAMDRSYPCHRGRRPLIFCPCVGMFWPCPWQLSNYIVCWKDLLYECLLVSSLSSYHRFFRAAWVLIDCCPQPLH